MLTFFVDHQFGVNLLSILFMYYIEARKNSELTRGSSVEKVIASAAILSLRHPHRVRLQQHFVRNFMQALTWARSALGTRLKNA